MTQKEEKIPFHRHFGLRLLQVLLVVLCLVLAKRCVDIYHENKITDEQAKIEWEESFRSLNPHWFRERKGIKDALINFFSEGGKDSK